MEGAGAAADAPAAGRLQVKSSEVLPQPAGLAEVRREGGELPRGRPFSLLPAVAERRGRGARLCQPVRLPPHHLPHPQAIREPVHVFLGREGALPRAVPGLRRRQVHSQQAGEARRHDNRHHSLARPPLPHPQRAVPLPARVHFCLASRKGQLPQLLQLRVLTAAVSSCLRSGGPAAALRDLAALGRKGLHQLR